jgi:threonine efflux protein
MLLSYQSILISFYCAVKIDMLMYSLQSFKRNNMTYLELPLIEIGLTYLAAIMAPGPSILAILRNSAYSKIIGVWTAVGTLIGIALQALYVLLGMRFIHVYPNVFISLQIICACYLIYLGVKGLVGMLLHNKKIIIDKLDQSHIIDRKEAFKQGFLIDALNPLALTFFLSIFSVFLGDDASLNFKILCWLEIVILGGLWFIGAALFLTSNKIRKILVGKVGIFVNLIALILFVYLGVKLFITAIN